MLYDFPHMINAWVPLFEVFSSICCVSLNKLLVFKYLVNLILQKHYHDKDPLLEFWWVLEILPVADIVIICGKS